MEIKNIAILLVFSAFYLAYGNISTVKAADLSKDQALLELSFERGIDPYTLEEAIQLITETEKKIQVCLKKADRKTCIRCCESSFGLLEPDKKRECKNRCWQQWPPDDGLSSLAN